MSTQLLDPDWIVPDWPAPPGVRALCTTRAGGADRGHAAATADEVTGGERLAQDAEDRGGIVVGRRVDLHLARPSVRRQLAIAEARCRLDRTRRAACPNVAIPRSRRDRAAKTGRHQAVCLAPLLQDGG